MSAVISGNSIHAGPVVHGSADAQCALALGAGSRTVAFGPGGAIDLETFLAEVRGVAALLPDATHAVNLCEDRYRFLVAFCAVAMRGQTTLLPPSRTRGAIDTVRALHPGSYCIGDTDACGCEHPGQETLDGGALSPHYVLVPASLPACPPPFDAVRPQIDREAEVVIGFTSGSTGVPSANRKTWGSFCTSTAQNLSALADIDGARPGTLHVVATVPPQHMYGMELSVLLPLLGDVAVHTGRPFFPADVAQALRDAPDRRVLVTTPVHLRALLESQVTLPPMAGIVTATAPLPQALAQQAEARYGCEVREMFGSTETCILAKRRTAREEAWTPLPGVSVHPRPDGTLARAAHLPEPVALADLMEVRGDGTFVLRGRHADLLEVAGKRASLGDLTQHLLAVPGVRDGVVLQLDGQDDASVRRIVAIAVAPSVSEATIIDALRARVDHVFLPRRLLLVDALPRNATGKLPRAALMALLQPAGNAARPRTHES